MSYKRIEDAIRPPSTLLDGHKDVALIATPEVLAASTVIKNSVIVQAKSTNTGAVYVGNAAGQHVELNKLDAVIVVCENLNMIYIKVAVNGEGVNYLGG